MRPTEELLKAPSIFLDETEFQILNEEDIHRLCVISDDMYERATAFKNMRVDAIQRYSDDDIVYALADMYEALEVRCLQLSELANKYISLLEDEQEKEDIFGSYDEQVRDTYYGGQL